VIRSALFTWKSLKNKLPAGYAMIAKKLVILTINIKVQRPNILSWASALRTSVADVICAGKNRINAAAVLLTLLILGSCATLPPERPAAEWFAVLPDSSTFYLVLNLDTAGALFREILIEADLEEEAENSLFERTSKVFGAVELKPGSAPAISLLLLGRYPRLAAKLQLSLSKSWKKVSSPETYWQHSVLNIQVAIPQKNVLLISTGAIHALLEGIKEPAPFFLPTGVKGDLKLADALVYFPELPGGGGAANEAQLPGLPIREVWIFSRGEDEVHELTASFNLSEVKNARILEALFRLLLTMWLRETEVENLAARLQGVEVRVEEKMVRITGLFFSAPELSRFFGALISQSMVSHRTSSGYPTGISSGHPTGTSSGRN